MSKSSYDDSIIGKLLVETAERIAHALDVPIWQLFVSEQDVLGGYEASHEDVLSDFCAFMRKGEKVCYVTSIKEAKSILADWEK